MTHRDDLQTFLEKLDDGWTMDQLQSQLIEAPAELQAQLRLAQQLKVSAASLPSLSAATRQSHQRQLMAAFAAENEARSAGWWSRLQAGLSGGPRRPVYLVGGAMAALAAIVIMVALLFNGLSHGEATIALNEASGTVEIAALDETSWQPLTITSELGAGQQIRTGSDGHAVLEFVDGSLIRLEPDSSIAINTLESEGDQLLEVSLTQQKGISRHDIRPHSGDYDHYLVHTPAGQIAVRGTRFNVNVATDGSTHVLVDSGQVEMSGQGRTVPIMLGEATLATVADGPAAPNTAFNGSGQISAMDGDNWTIGGLPAQVPATAVGRDQVALNEQVAVTGRLLDDGTWLVDILQPASLITNEFSLTAQLNDFSDTAITVGTHRLGITASSIFNDGTNLGQYVTVQVMAEADGQVHVTAIAPLADGDSLLVTITPSTTASATMTATATIMPTPDASGQVTICHRPPGNPATNRTIRVGYGSLDAHLAHGDTVGLCPGETATPTISPTMTITATVTLTATPTITATTAPTLTSTPDAGTNPAPTTEPETQLTICHIPNGNPDNAQTITIDASSWPAHQAHGDYLGSCSSPSNPDGGGTPTGGNNGGGNNGGGNNGGGGNGNGGGGGSGNGGGNNGGGNNGGGNGGGNGG